MSERITEAELGHLELIVVERTGHLAGDDILRLVAEMRRLRGLIVPMAGGTLHGGVLEDDPEGAKMNALVAEARAIRAEEACARV